MQFNFDQLVIVGITTLRDQDLKCLQSISKAQVAIFSSIEDVVDPIVSQTDCLLVNIQTIVDASLLKKVTKLRYIGVYGSSLRNIDIEVATRLGIQVSPVVGYCDTETAEFVIFVAYALARGLLRDDWPEFPYSLHGKTMGIIGMGKTGTSLCKLARGIGMGVLYYSRTLKPELEDTYIAYSKLEDVVSKSDIISLHVPPYTQALSAEDFSYMRNSAVLVNTCIGQVFREEDLIKWLSLRSNTAIFDSIAARAYERVFLQSNVIRVERAAYATSESIMRLREKLIQNARTFLINSSAQ
ncbi:NAD(P)-dependent oxidoreductase [Nostoc sp.]|uniref:NAD(P)-dependent oxidoreductase n=1 Tax=Nostoc sp. TaxID=1180 RepID=UPI002FFB2FFB